MDKRMRRNEFCVVGSPRCDFVFSSTRSCFIAYGFRESPLEMRIIKNLLEKRGIEAIEASETSAPGQFAFCSKICSKIITSQFCIVLANHDVKENAEMPNANVNMEYGLMLGFNKYVIPFQRESQELPFNFAPLDTVKYDQNSFEDKAAKAIDLAIKETTQTDDGSIFSGDQILEIFLLSRDLMVLPLNNEGDTNLYELGKPLGFSLLATFDGMRYSYFGNFTFLRPEVVLWRLKKLENIIVARFNSVPERADLGLFSMNAQTLKAIQLFLKDMTIMLLVTSNGDRDRIRKRIAECPGPWKVEVLSLDDVRAVLDDIVCQELSR